MLTSTFCCIGCCLPDLLSTELRGAGTENCSVVHRSPHQKVFTPARSLGLGVYWFGHSVVGQLVQFLLSSSLSRYAW